MNEGVVDIAKSATGGIIEQGVTGSMMVLFFLISGALLYTLLKDRSYQKTTADAFVDMAENQKRFTELYKNFQEYHQKTVGMLTEILKEERSNTKDCYKKVADGQSSLDTKIEELLRINK